MSFLVLLLVLILIIFYFVPKKIPGGKSKLSDHVRSVALQFHKDKNELNDNSISDALIGFTLHCMKKSHKDVKEYFTDLKGVEIVFKEREGSLSGKLSNGCMLSILSDFDEVYNINIYLNADPSKEDIKNLKLFALAHKKEYVLINEFCNKVGKPKIAFENRLSHYRNNLTNDINSRLN